MTKNWSKGEVKIRQNAPIGVRGGKFKKDIPNGGWNAVRLILKSLPKNQPYFVKDDGKIIKIVW